MLHIHGFSSTDYTAAGCLNSVRLPGRVDLASPHITYNESDDLPYPAVKLVIAQHFWIHPDCEAFAWLIIGAFYDVEDNELWHIELRLGATNIHPQSWFGRLLREYANTPVLRRSESSTEVSTSTYPTTEDPNEIYRHLSRVPTAPANNQTPQHPEVLARLPPSIVTQMAGNGQGWNPRWGWDAQNNNTSPFGVGGNGAAPFGYGGPQAFYGVNMMPQPGMYTQPGAGQGPAFVVPQNGQQVPVPMFPNQPGGARMPNPHPVVSHETPALNLTNSTGGVGCEPGYNYYFPALHTKIHVIKSNSPPWRLPAGMSMHFGAYHVPVNTSIAELMKGFGATNSSAKKNRVTEVVQGGNGKWYKGLTISGDDKDDMKKLLKDLGWDQTRTGRPGEKPVVWLWITRD